MAPRAHNQPKRRQGGITLIEVLITVVVVSIGLLGLTALQAVSLKANRTALQRSYATMYAYDIVDCMRANRSAARASQYNLDFDTPASGSSIAATDMAAWKGGIANDLPNGQGQVFVDASGNAAVDISWTETAESDRTTTFSTQSTL